MKMYIPVVQITTIYGVKRFIEKGKYHWLWSAYLMAKLGAMYYDYFEPHYGSEIRINYGVRTVDK